MPRRHLRDRAILFAGLVALLAPAAGCGTTGPAEPPRSGRKPTAASAPEPEVAARPGHFRRREVETVLGHGPPWLLRRVAVEEVLRDGKFVGWRVLAVPEDWSSVDLKAGDVVTRVNGKVIERPDDLWSVWLSLYTAKELRIAYERNNAAKEIAFPIDGEPSPQAIAAARGDAPVPKSARPDARRTVVIEEAPLLGEDDPPTY